LSARLTTHRELKDPVREAEDLRIKAGALALNGGRDESATLLREVIERATEHGRPLLLAMAERDLAHLLIQMATPPAARQLPARSVLVPAPFGPRGNRQTRRLAGDGLMFQRGKLSNYAIGW